MLSNQETKTLEGMIGNNGYILIMSNGKEFEIQSNIDIEHIPSLLEAALGAITVIPPDDVQINPRLN